LISSISLTASFERSNCRRRRRVRPQRPDAAEKRWHADALCQLCGLPVGGANSAGQAALYAAEFARSVTILVRGP
jgi:hypothetical protein